MAALQPLLMARAAHAGGVCFALAGLATLLLLLVVQDLAFGWSTTLNTATESYHRLLSTIALPWQWLWPAAVPSQELVEATRFFRVAPTDSDTAPERWGAWWPFVVMLWSTWVLLPRLVLWTLSHWLLGRKARCLLTRHPAMQALRYRMEAPALDTGSQHNDAGDLPDTHRQAKPQPLIPSSLVISWAGATGLRLPQLLLAPDVELFKAGGRATLVEDTQVLAAVADRLQAIKEPRVALVVCGWEPPTGELFDFLVQARAQWPQSTKLAIVPLGQDTEPLSNPLLRTWLRFAERLPVGFASVTPASPAKVNEEAVR